METFTFCQDNLNIFLQKKEKEINVVDQRAKLWHCHLVYSSLGGGTEHSRNPNITDLQKKFTGSSDFCKCYVSELLKSLLLK